MTLIFNVDYLHWRILGTTRVLVILEVSTNLAEAGDCGVKIAGRAKVLVTFSVLE